MSTTYACKQGNRKPWKRRYVLGTYLNAMLPPNIPPRLANPPVLPTNSTRAKSRLAPLSKATTSGVLSVAEFPTKSVSIITPLEFELIMTAFYRRTENNDSELKVKFCKPMKKTCQECLRLRRSPQVFRYSR